MRLWEGRAPGALDTTAQDIPILTAYLPRTPSAPRTAVVICSGGGYGWVATKYEGKQAQEFLSPLGVTVFTLDYRVGPRYHHPVELGDALRAMRMVRAHAAEWGIDPHKIGIMGFSAGGHLASTVSTHFDVGNPAAEDPIDRVGSRPDFAILVYPVITMSAPYAHEGSRRNLLGLTPDTGLVRMLSNERMVTASTPPTFLYHTDADAEVPVENSVLYYLALRKAGVHAELHVFQNGPHGSAMGQGDPALSIWPPLLAEWLRVNGWVPAASAK